MSEAVLPRRGLALGGGYHSPQVEVAVRLNTNESPLPPPEAFVRELAEELGRLPLHRYPDRRALALRRALAEAHGVAPDQVFCANGSNEVLQCLLLAYGGPGRRAAVFEPTYSLHAHIARLTGTEVASGARGARFATDLGEVRRVLEAAAPAVTFLCSPNNPTGLAETREVVEAVLAVAPGLVVVDEAYGQFAPWTALDLVDDDRQLVVVRTFSKTWAAAGLRLGYCVGPSAVVGALEAVALPYHLDAVKQLAGRLALRYEAEMRARVAALVAWRAELAAGLGRLPVETWPSDANFLLFRPVARGAKEVWEGLLERSVLVRDVSDRPFLEGCLRVTVGTPEENAAFLEALRECLA
jgi:histidinol-phosphate aminotransferase